MAAGVKSPTLPNEIQDHILDFLHDSKPALKACALVCRAWVPTSRYHLFSKIQVPGRGANAFEELFASPNCTIRHVKACTSSSAAIWKIGHVLRHLTPSSLHLIHRDQQTLATSAPFPAIVCLCVDLRYAPEVATLDLLVAFPNIRELYVENCAIVSLPPRDRGDILRLPRLRLLEFSHCYVEPLLRFFMEKGIAPTNILSIKDLDSDEVSIVGEYFSMFGNRLQEIRMGFVREDEVLGMSRFIILWSVLILMLSSSARYCDDARFECL